MPNCDFNKDAKQLYTYIYNTLVLMKQQYLSWNHSANL